MKSKDVTTKYAFTNSGSPEAEPLSMKTSCGIPWHIDGLAVGNLLGIRRAWDNEAIDSFGFDLNAHPVRASVTVSGHAHYVLGLRPLLVGLLGEGCGWIEVSESSAITGRDLAEGVVLRNWRAFEWEVIADALNFVLGLDLVGEES